MHTRLYKGAARKGYVLNCNIRPVVYGFLAQSICLMYLDLLSAMSLLRCTQLDGSDKSSSYGTAEGTAGKAIHTQL